MFTPLYSQLSCDQAGYYVIRPVILGSGQLSCIQVSFPFGLKVNVASIITLAGH